MIRGYLSNRWIDSGRKVFSDLIVRAQKDPVDFVEAYDDLVDYLVRQSRQFLITKISYYTSREFYDS
jgi:hypothetical protein